VKAAFLDAQKLRQVTKGKRTSEAKQEAPFDNTERDSKKKRKIVRRIQTAQTKMLGKYFVWFPWTHTAIVQRGKYGFDAPSAICGPMKNELLAFPGDIFVPTASRMYQMKISAVLWVYISVPLFIFQCNL
jgi:hypothetical protein